MERNWELAHLHPNQLQNFVVSEDYHPSGRTLSIHYTPLPNFTSPQETFLEL